jgi:hypothetical protein
MNTYTNIFEVFAAGKKAVERDKRKTDIAAVAENLAAAGMGLGAGEGRGDRCGSSARAICAT